MGLKRLLSCFLILVLVLITAAGCGGAPELTAMELIPRNANMIVSIQVSKILNDQDLRDAYNRAEIEEGQPQTFEEALDNVIEETGIDPRDISEAVVFADMTSIEEAEYLGIIVEATFDKNELIDQIEEEWGLDFTVSDYKGYELYIDQDEGFAFTFLSDEMVLLGTTQAVKDAIDVSKGEKAGASGVVLDTYNRFGDALIKLALKVPEETRESITEEPMPGDMPISMESFADVETVGFALGKEMETITARIDLHFLSAESAEDAGDTLSSTIGFFGAMSPDQQIKELLDKIEVEIADSWVIINYAITLSEIEELMETFEP